MTSLGNPRVLLSKPAMATLQATIHKTSGNAREILNQTVSAIRISMEAGLRIIFIIGFATMLPAFLIICTIPEISIEAQAEDKKAL
jgi:hypothetical protein